MTPTNQPEIGRLFAELGRVALLRKLDQLWDKANEKHEETSDPYHAGMAIGLDFATQAVELAMNLKAI